MAKIKSALENIILSIFIFSSIFIILTLAFTTLSALFNLFKLPVISFSLLGSFLLSILLSKAITKYRSIFPRLDVTIIIIIALVLIVFIFFPHDTFGGRDESIFSNYAVYLSQTGTLNFPSYLEHLPNDYIEGVRTRLPAYTVWLALQNIFFGYKWLLSSNTILTGLGLISLYSVAVLVGGKKVGIISLMLYISSMPFLWFSRETMTENLSFFLVWFSILQILLFLKTGKIIFLVCLFLTVWLFSLTRIEGFFIQFSVALILMGILILRKFYSLKNIILIISLYLLIIISSVFIIKLFLFDSYITESVHNVKFNFNKDIPSIISLNSPNNINSDSLSKNIPEFIAKMLVKYNLIIVLTAIGFAFIGETLKIKKPSTINFPLIAVLIVLAPEFYKLTNPTVTLDQPWLYRRYVYALLPLGYICLSMILSRINEKKIVVPLFTALFIINIVLSGEILFLKNNWLLIGTLSQVTAKVTKNDLVIIRNSTLGNYSPTSYLTVQKGIRSISSTTANSFKYIPEQNILNGIRYGKIYILSNLNKESFPNSKATLLTSSDITYIQLKRTCQLYLLGQEEEIINPYNMEFFPLSLAESYCKLAGNKIEKNDEKLYLYELSAI